MTLDLDEEDTDGIRALLLGHRIAKVGESELELDDGTRVRVVPNIGGCSCGAGDYELTALNGVDNIITRVEFDYQPTGDFSAWPRADLGYYRIFVFAEDRRFDLLRIDGDDGNGYYGTGFELVVEEPTFTGRDPNRPRDGA